MTTAEPLSKFVALHAELSSIGLTLSGKIGGDVARILDEDAPVAPDPQLTSFSIQRYPARPGVHPMLWRRLGFDELAQILTALEAEAPHLPAGLDAPLFHAFVARVKQELSSQASNRFTEARFGEVTREHGGAIVAHFGLGIDMAGTLHDAHGRIAAEQHVVPMHPGHFRRLSRADRLSLAAALAHFIQSAPPPVNSLWSQLAEDASK